MPPRLLSLLLRCVHLSFHTRPRAPTCAPRGRVKCGTNSAEVESMTSAMSVAMSLMKVPSRIGGSAFAIVFATWNRRLGSVINRLRSVSFGVSLVLSLFLRFGADLRGMRTLAHTRLSSGSGASKGTQRTLTQRISRRSACFVKI